MGRLGFRVGVSASYSYKIISFQLKFEDDSAISVLHRRRFRPIQQLV